MVFFFGDVVRKFLVLHEFIITLYCVVLRNRQTEAKMNHLTKIFPPTLNLTNP